MSSGLSCPFPIAEYPRITMAHGGGGRLSGQLIEKLFAPAFLSSNQEIRHDAACVPRTQGALAFTTDSYVVKPLFFPGGDIGRLAVCGTVNDLAMAGAKPLWLSAGFILEEGLLIESLWRILQSMREAALQSGIQIITGDTKVVERGRCDGVYINTSGIGSCLSALKVHPQSVRPGDRIILSGDIGRHGIAVLAEREGLTFEKEVQSDVAPLSPVVEKLFASNVPVHCLRDLTRGGLATALVELASTSGLSFLVDEPSVQVDPGVRGACELLGLDPLFVANEGRFVAFVEEMQVKSALEVLSQLSVSCSAKVIGQVMAPQDYGPELILRNAFGRTRRVERLSGEQLPRIC